ALPRRPHEPPPLARPPRRDRARASGHARAASGRAEPAAPERARPPRLPPRRARRDGAPLPGALHARRPEPVRPRHELRRRVAGGRGDGRGEPAGPGRDRRRRAEHAREADERVQPVRRRRLGPGARRRVPGLPHADGEAARRPPLPHAPRPAPHRRRRLVDGRADLPVRVLQARRDVRLRGGDEPVALAQRRGDLPGRRGRAVLPGAHLPRHRAAGGRAPRRQRAPPARPARRQGLPGGGRPALDRGRARPPHRERLGPPVPRRAAVPARRAGRAAGAPPPGAARLRPAARRRV
ncbi:MAG: putative esterase, partial [uncultured Gemmatimonadaceae bacterium]